MAFHIRPAAADDLDRAADVLAAAFDTYAWTRWTIPRDGYRDRLLLSQDVFLKTMLVRYGGRGYAHLLDSFIPRLHRHGLTADDTDHLLIANPRAVFETAAKGEDE